MFSTESRKEYFQRLKQCVLADGLQVDEEESAYIEALKYFYCTMHTELKTDFSYVNSLKWDWQFKDFNEFLAAEGVEEIIQIVAEGVPSPYLIEKQYRRLDGEDNSI